MPTYSYQCEQCLHEFDALQKMSDEPLKTCPHCQAQAVVRKISVDHVSFHFEGSGFYLTDYKKKGSDPGSKS